MAEAFRRPYLDSSVYIAAIKGERDRAPVAKAILREAQAGKIHIVASTFVITEVLRGRDYPRLSVAEERKVDAFFEHEFITWVELDVLAARHARDLARAHNLRPADAVHLASAIRGGADQLLRWDSKFRLREGVYESVAVCDPHLAGRAQPLPGLEDDDPS